MQGRKRFIDSQHGTFVGVDVEVAYRVVDQLRLSVYTARTTFRHSGTYGSGILIEQHSEVRSTEVLGAEEIGKCLDLWSFAMVKSTTLHSRRN